MSDSEETEIEAGGENLSIATNKVVAFHYRLSAVDAEGNYGPWMEQSHGKRPLYYLHGFHNVIVGLEKALEGKIVGDAIKITLQPDQAYGERDPNAVQRVPIKHLQLSPGSTKLRPGTLATVETNRGRHNVIVVKAGKFNADVDFNHPLSGKTLYYEVEVVAVRDATEAEIAHGHVHGPGGHNHENVNKG